MLSGLDSLIQQMLAMGGRTRLSKPFGRLLDGTIQNHTLVTVVLALIEYADIIERLPEATDDEAESRRQSAFRMAWTLYNSSGSPSQLNRVLFEVAITRNIDSFNYYLSDMLRWVFTSRPETLITSEQTTIREVIESGDMDEFIHRIAEKKVLDLSFKGLPAVIKYLNTNLGLAFDENNPDYQVACEYTEVRNIIVHNAGLVSNLYLQRTGRTDLEVEELYELSSEYTLAGMVSLVRLGFALDLRFLEHFKLHV